MISKIEGTIIGNKASGDTMDAFFEANLQDVYAYVLRRVTNEAQAEDIVAEVFADAFRSAGKRKSLDVRPWLFGMARRKIADHYRRKGIRREVHIDEKLVGASRSPLIEAVAGEETTVVRRLVEQLPEDQREALLLYFVEELTAPQIGTVMGRSRFAVNSLLQRAKKSIFEKGRTYFSEDGANEHER